MTVYRYALEQLYADQDFEWVVDTIPAVVAWVPGDSRPKRSQPFRFPLRHTVGQYTSTHQLELTWDIGQLRAQDPTVSQRAKRLRTGKTVQREHLAELAAYGLTLVAISVLMPRRRVVAMNNGVAPDFLFDVTPNRLSGVEAAGRSRGGWGALNAVGNGTPKKRGKRKQLLARTDIAEVSLSLWCASPRASVMEQVKP
ncbi:MAG: hypothetical protein GXP55_09150 [Deltaproteobacteria bacterium]|nr:hypothetical protein [Deltaproteobacteria bacterium]